MNPGFSIRRGKLGRLLILVTALAAAGLSDGAHSAPAATPDDGAVAATPATATTTSPDTPMLALVSPGARNEHLDTPSDGMPPAPTLLPATQLQAWLQRQPGYPRDPALRVDIEWLPPRGRQKLAPCQQAEAFLPTGARLWGRLNIGIRCVAGARWTSWQPVHLRIFGPALVTRHPLAAGQVPQRQDFLIQEVEWSQHRHPPAALDTTLATQQLQRALAAGQPLRADHLRALPAIRAGEPVAAIAEGDGFRISTDAIALSQASEGQNIRVRTASGKVLTGKVEGKTVKIFR
ncbi:MAG: flagellar basal body P-ring formation chaperone FlgA [Lautropia sp.]|nr:flagellar basal body P-ring formation chaperone FlgA [Lautropia sp.]